MKLNILTLLQTYLPMVFLVASLSLCLLMLLPSSASSDDPPYPKDVFRTSGNLHGDRSDFSGQILSPVERVDIVEQDDDKADLVWKYRKSVVTMPDEDISVPQNNPDPFGDVLHRGPGTTAKGYNFYPSPDHKWLFVHRPIFRRFGVCYLYHKVDAHHAAAVRVDGKRLDDAAFALYARRHHIDAKLLGGGARVTHFTRWDWRRHRVIFWVEGSSYWYTAKSENVKDVSGVWTVVYSFRTNKLTILSDRKHL